jgi:hypothetical protein
MVTSCSRADGLIDQAEALKTLIFKVGDDFEMVLGWELVEGHECKHSFA